MNRSLEFYEIRQQNTLANDKRSITKNLKFDRGNFNNSQHNTKTILEFYWNRINM